MFAVVIFLTGFPLAYYAARYNLDLDLQKNELMFGVPFSADHLRVQGPDDPQTLRTREELARWTGEAGNPTAAAAALAALLHDQLRVVGPSHPRTAEIRKDLARWQAAAESS